MSSYGDRSCSEDDSSSSSSSNLGSRPSLVPTHASGREALQLAINRGSIESLIPLLRQEAESLRDNYSGREIHSALQVAVSEGHVDAMDRLLEAGADPDTDLGIGVAPALQIAAEHGQLVLVKKLLEHGAHPDFGGQFGHSNPIQAATKAGHIEIVKVLLQAGADASYKTIFMVESAFAVAVKVSNVALVDLFLGLFAEVSRGFNSEELRVVISQGRQEDSRKLSKVEKHLGAIKQCIRDALAIAAGVGNIYMIQKLFDTDVYLDAGIRDHAHTAIAAAAARGHTEMLEKLLEVSAAVNNTPTTSVTIALQSAADMGHLTMIEPLFQAGANIASISIQIAALKGHVEVMRFLLDAGASVEGKQESYRRGNNTPLQSAVRGGHREAIDLLLARGANINAPAKNERGGGTALQLAVAGRFVAVIKSLIGAGADVNAPPGTTWDDTAVQAAVRVGSMPIFELLLAAGAVVDSANQDHPFAYGTRTSLLIASERNNAEFLTKLLSIMSPGDAHASASAALQVAVERNHIEVVRQLLQIHPDVNASESHHPTLLQRAASGGNFEIVTMLLAARADVNLDPTGGGQYTALQSASKWGWLDFVKLMLAAGAVINVTGSTAPPLQLAIRHGHVQVFEYLLAAGADIHASSYRGQTMLQAAEQSGNVDMQEKVNLAISNLDYSQGQLNVQPFGRGTGPLCSPCLSAPLVELITCEDWAFEIRNLHPSLIALKESVDAKCPFCCFLWRRLELTSVSLPQPSPVCFFSQRYKGTITCTIEEPFPKDVEKPESLTAHFCVAIQPSGSTSPSSKIPPKRFALGCRIPITEDTSSLATYNQIRSWLETCNEGHSKCRTSLKEHFLPTRLVQVNSSESTSTNSTSKPRLVTTNSIKLSNVKYIALSYRWPQNFPDAAKSTRATLHQQMQALEIAKLPQSFNDVFQVAAKLDINYVWIDSLCIVQDDANDWNLEASRMGQVYRNAYFTLAIAVLLNTPDQSMFYRGDPSDILSEKFECPSRDGVTQEVEVMKCQPDWMDIYKRSALISRGWCFQEREMSPRIVHYTANQVLWECRTFKATEESPNGIAADRGFEPAGRISDQLEQVDGGSANNIWHYAVEDYSARNLTQVSDKFPALAGLAALMHSCKPVRSRYLAGLWEDDFPRCLGWASAKVGQNSAVTNTRHSTYIAPTWSWASVAGPITYMAIEREVQESPGSTVAISDSFSSTSPATSSQPPNALDSKYVKLALHLLDISVQLSGLSPYGSIKNGILKCKGGLVPAVVSNTQSYDAFGQQFQLKTLAKKMIGDMYFDVPQERKDGEGIKVVFCVFIAQLLKADTGLALVPTGLKDKEYRRVGIIPSILLPDLDSFKLEEFTII